MEKNSQPNFTTIKQAAWQLGVSEIYLRRLGYRGGIATLRFGTMVRIPQTEIDRLIAENLVPSTDSID
jgi:excisionase family DNA binding protein